jgi:hypothetical protein
VKRPVGVLVSAVICVVVALSATAGFAQTKAGDQKTTVTGCLQKGDEANEFAITGEDGKTYQLRNSAVDLSKHAGHKVTITGIFKAEKKEGQSAEYNQEEATEAGSIRVATLKMVNDKCK